MFSVSEQNVNVFLRGQIKGFLKMDDKAQAEISIHIAIKTAPKSLLKSLNAKTPIEHDKAVRTFTTHIIGALKGYNITKIQGYGAGDAITERPRP